MSNYNATNDGLEGVSGMTLTDIYNALGLLLSGTNVTVMNLPSTQNVTLGALNYPTSVNNTTNIQLAPNKTFTGVIESILSLQAAQVEVVCDQPYIVNINQYIDQAGTQLTDTTTFIRQAGQPICENITLPGNYFNVVLTNVGNSSTTTLSLNTTFGIMNTLPSSLSNYGNLTVAVQEVNGAPIPTAGIPVYDTSINDALVLIRRLLKISEALANIDSSGRQRVTLDNISANLTLGTVTNITNLPTLANVTTVGTVNSVAAVPNFLGMNQQQFSDNARTAYNTGVRQNLIFS